jgi:hypothetical protein
VEREQVLQGCALTAPSNPAAPALSQFGVVGQRPCCTRPPAVLTGTCSRSQSQTGPRGPRTQRSRLLLIFGGRGDLTCVQGHMPPGTCRNANTSTIPGSGHPAILPRSGVVSRHAVRAQHAAARPFSLHHGPQPTHRPRSGPSGPPLSAPPCRGGSQRPPPPPGIGPGPRPWRRPLRPSGRRSRGRSRGPARTGPGVQVVGENEGII